MSRYNSVDTITFEDKDGNAFAVKDIRPIPGYETLSIEKWNNEMMIDEFLSKPQLYGDEAEDLSYTVVDHNAEKIIENNFDFTKIKQLRIPLINERRCWELLWIF